MTSSSSCPFPHERGCDHTWLQSWALTLPRQYLDCTAILQYFIPFLSKAIHSHFGMSLSEEKNMPYKAWKPLDFFFLLQFLNQWNPYFSSHRWNSETMGSFFSFSLCWTWWSWQELHLFPHPKKSETAPLDFIFSPVTKRHAKYKGKWIGSQWRRTHAKTLSVEPRCLQISIHGKERDGHCFTDAGGKSKESTNQKMWQSLSGHKAWPHYYQAGKQIKIWIAMS